MKFRNILLTVLLLLTVTVFGQSKSLRFNGGTIDSQYVSVHDDLRFGLVDNWTMEAWVYFNGFDVSESHIFRLEAQIFVNSSRNLQVQADGTYISGPTKILKDVWYHIAYVRTPTEVTVYVNGELELVADGADVGALRRFVFGSYSEPSTRYYLSGIMDDVRLWNHARTQAEIIANKDDELSGTEDGLIVYYDFNNGSGSTVSDRAGGDNDGTLGGMDESNWVTDTPMGREYLPEGSELLTNNYFNDDLSNWNLFVNAECNAVLDLDNSGKLEGTKSAHIKVNSLSSSTKEDAHIQFYQDIVAPSGIKAGRKYHVQYKIKASKAVNNIYSKIHQAHNPWEEIVPDEDYSVLSLMPNKSTTIRDTLIFNKTDDVVKLSINLGVISEENIEFWVDAIHLIELPKDYEEIDENLPRGKELLSNNYFVADLESWDMYKNEQSNSTLVLDTDGAIEDANSAKVHLNKVYSDGQWKIQFRQKKMLAGIEEGRKYHVQFMVKSSKTISGIFAVIQELYGSFATAYQKELTLPADEVITIIDTFYCSKTDTLVEWSFDLGTASVANVDLWFDAIHLIELPLEYTNLFPPESAWEVTRPKTLPRPEYLESIHDSKYGVDITRISDATVFNVEKNSYKLWNHYPKDPAWNADMSLISLNNGHFLLNGDDYSIYKEFSYRLNESRWSSVNPELKYFCSGDKLKKINIETEEVTTLHSFPGYNLTIGPWEGNLSADDKYVVLTHESGGSAVKASLYDIELDSVISTMEIPDGANWISITPSGEYIVLENNKTDNTEVYDLQFNYLRKVGSGTQHGDFGVDSEGNEVWIQVIPVSMHRLSDGKSTRLFKDNTGGHISGRGFNNPGWALVDCGIYEGGSGSTGYSGLTELAEVKLDGSGIVRHFGHARSSYNIRNSSSMGTVSPDGKKIIFNSDWNLFNTGVIKDEILAYIVEYREITGVDENGLNSKEKMGFELSQNYPNPFNPTTTINFKLRVEGMAKLVVYNILGQQVQVLLNENMRAGSYSVPFIGSNLTSGIYFYKLQSNNQVEVKKMLLLK